MWLKTQRTGGTEDRFIVVAVDYRPPNAWRQLFLPIELPRQ
jgi:hypothetical protein